MNTKRIDIMTLAIEKRVTLAETAIAAAAAATVPRIKMSSKKRNLPISGFSPAIQ